ncbi:MAG: DUF1588 domain-containing protein [Planctomycetota bacterium]
MPLLLHAIVMASTGAEIFNDQCADCHGADGQGESGAYEQPLYGDSSVELLAKLIERTMPEGDAEAVVGEDARSVADYIYHEFYSLDARIKKGLATAPRIELLRLTIPQYRNSVADMIGRFTPRPETRRKRRNKEQDEKKVVPGLTAKYYQSKGMTKTKDMKVERVDSRIDADYQEASPDESITADQFAVIWDGGLVVRHTGYHEFRITTENGARLHLNNDQTGQRRGLRDDSGAAGQTALIDAWVSTGKQRSETARVFLVGGRTYPIRLEFFKYKEKSASIRLEWRPPHAPWSVLDHNHLVTGRYARSFALATSFPADDRSLGYERGSSVSSQWHEATGRAAIEVADEIVDRLPLLIELDKDADKRAPQLKEFVSQLGQVAFRRPLADAEKTLFTESLFSGVDGDAAVRRAILLLLSSPHFLYVDLDAHRGADGPHAVAARMSYALCDTIPDAELAKAVDQGKLATEAHVRDHARRLVDSPQARDKLARFFHHWLEMDERDIAKDDSLYPVFDETVAADLRFSLERFIEDAMQSESADYRQLLLADSLLLNEELKAIYSPEANPAESNPTESSTDEDVEDATEESAAEEGSDKEDLVAQDNNEFHSVQFAADRRAGVLTHPYLLSAFAYHNNTSPIHRGVFLTRNVFGRSLRPPPIAVAFKDDEFAPELTMREKITQLTSDTACMSCHSVINPLGFALESYDAIGRYRTSDNDKPVNTTSQYTTATGETLTVHNARELAEYAASSPQAHAAFVSALFKHMVQQDPAAYGANTLDELRIKFAESEFNVRKLSVDIAVVASQIGSQTKSEEKQ